MPRGKPKQTISLRIAPETIVTIRLTGIPVTQAIEEGLALWLERRKRDRRRAAALLPSRHATAIEARKGKAG
jgi:hypothetical protein